jgi:hypothetical protein
LFGWSKTLIDEWYVHYQSGGQQYCAHAIDRATAIAVACILLRDGHEVVKLESSAGEIIEAPEIRTRCAR